MLSTDSPYKKDDMVSGRVYYFIDNFGTFIAVDDKYSAKIPVFENAAYLKLGDVICLLYTSLVSESLQRIKTERLQK